MRRKIAWLLAAALCVGSLSACADGSDKNETGAENAQGSAPASETAEEPETEETESEASQESAGEESGSDFGEEMDIELMAYFVMDVDETDSIVQYINDKFNVNLKLTITSESDYDDTLNMRIAGGDMPDWFRVSDQGIYGQLVEDGMLLNVSELVDKYHFENIAAQFQVDRAEYLQTDGVFYRIPDTVGCLNRGIFYRKDWLDKLELEQPKTWDEFADMLRAFAEADLDGTGASGFTSYGNVAGLEIAQSAYTGYRNWGLLPDGSLIYKYEDDNYKEMLRYWKELFAENGTLDPEIMIASSTEAMEKFCTGRCGALMMNVNSSWYTTMESDLKAYKADAELGLLIPVLEGPAGAYMNGYFGFSADSSFSSSLSEEKAVRILSIFDYLLSPEGRELTLYGLEGQHHDVVDGVKVPREETLNTEWGQNQHLLGEVADFGSNNALITNETMLEWLEYTSNPENVRADLTGYFTNERATIIQSTLNELRVRYLVPFVTGEMDIDSEWENFQQELKNAGIDELRQLTADYFAGQGASPDPAVQ